MKTNIRTIFNFAILPALFLLLFAAGCQKASDTTNPDPQGGEFWLKGSVIDATTHQGIANARIVFDDKTVLTTDAGGVYKIDCNTLASGSFDVRAMANGYGFGFASATIGDGSAMVNTIMLAPVSEPVSIGTTGGTIALADPESIASDGKTTLFIPAGALTGNTNITLTRFTGIDVPGYAPANMLNLCAVNIGPAGTTVNNPVELRFALPFNSQPAENLPLLKYDFETNNWENTGVIAQVNSATNIATVQVSAFGTYSLAVAGSFTETNGTSGTAITLPLDRSLNSVNLTFQGKNEYPAGIPATISLSYLKNIASQNTKIHGIRVSFKDLTTVTFNYIGSKPDSLAPVKSTAAGFYRWMPKVIYAPQDMPMTTMIHGTTVTGIIQKHVYSGDCGYEFVHDQGGGGK